MAPAGSRRHDGFGGVPLWFVFFAIFLIFALVVTGAVYLTAQKSAQKDVVGSANKVLGGAIADLRLRLDNTVSMTEAALGAACVSPPERVRATAQQVLRSTPNLHALWVVEGTRAAYHLQPDGDTWIAEEVDLIRKSSTWTRFDGAFETVLSSERGEPDTDPLETAWYQGALTRMGGRSDENTRVPVLAYWDAPRRLPSLEGPGVLAAAAVNPAESEPIVIAFEVDLRPIARLTSRVYDVPPERMVVIAEETGIVAPPHGAALPPEMRGDAGLAPPEALEGHAMYPGFQRWRNDTYPPERAFPSVFDGARWWQHYVRYEEMGGHTLFLGAAVPDRVVAAGFAWLSTQLMLILGGALGLALLLAFGLSAGLGRPIAHFNKRMRRVDALDLQHAHMPRSRIREFNELARSMNDLLADVHARTGGEAKSADTPAAAAPVAQDGVSAPPQAYLQALQSSRRQLRELQSYVETLQQQIAAEEGGPLPDARAWDNVLETLAKAAPTARRTELLYVGCALTGGERCGLWREDDGGLWLVQRYDLLRDQLDSGASLDAGEVPQAISNLLQRPGHGRIEGRDAGRLPGPALDAPPACAALAVAFEGAVGQTALLIVEQVSAAVTWSLPQQQNATALAALLLLLEMSGADPLPAVREKPRRAPVEDLEEYGEAPLYRQLVEAVGQPLAAILPNGGISFVNTAFEDCFDQDAAELLGYPYWDLVAEEDAERVQEAVEAVIQSGMGRTLEAWHGTRGQEPRRAHLDISPLEDEEGEVTGAVLRLRMVEPGGEGADF